jgi:hypothetical protein
MLNFDEGPSLSNAGTNSALDLHSEDIAGKHRIVGATWISGPMNFNQQGLCAIRKGAIARAHLRNLTSNRVT